MMQSADFLYFSRSYQAIPRCVLCFHFFTVSKSIAKHTENDRVSERFASTRRLGTWAMAVFKMDHWRL